MLPENWRRVLASDAWSDPMQRADDERATRTVYPHAEQVFRAFELTSYDDVRVVIVGQDPYHGKGQAHGLAFSVAQGRIPPSLRKILKALEHEVNVLPPDGGNLESWARQGVLLLNTVLTVRAGSPNSHREMGWQVFTRDVIEAVNAKREPVVFLLWGAQARKLAPLVTNEQHKVLTAAHPAARANAKNLLIDEQCFSRANAMLGQDREIVWGVPRTD